MRPEMSADARERIYVCRSVCRSARSANRRDPILGTKNVDGARGLLRVTHSLL
jgi:hypothetical protein